MKKIAIIAACLLAAGSMSAVGDSANATIKEKIFNKDEVKTIKGNVKDIQRIKFGAMEKVHAVLDVDGKTVVVLLGPARYLEELNFDPKVGDAWEVTGFSIEGSKDFHFIAKSIKFNDKEFNFRDDDGAPAWMMGPMQK